MRRDERFSKKTVAAAIDLICNDLKDGRLNLAMPELTKLAKHNDAVVRTELTTLRLLLRGRLGVDPGDRPITLTVRRRADQEKMAAGIATGKAETVREYTDRVTREYEQRRERAAEAIRNGTTPYDASRTFRVPLGYCTNVAREQRATG